MFNNAGYGICAEAESTPNDAARKMFDVNFWGAANVSREAVRVFREVNGHEKGGWLLNVSSGAGLMGLPASSYYCARCVRISPCLSYRSHVFFYSKFGELFNNEE